MVHAATRQAGSLRPSVPRERILASVPDGAGAAPVDDDRSRSRSQHRRREHGEGPPDRRLSSGGCDRGGVCCAPPRGAASPRAICIETTGGPCRSFCTGARGGCRQIRGNRVDLHGYKEEQGRRGSSIRGVRTVGRSEGRRPPPPGAGRGDGAALAAAARPAARRRQVAALGQHAAGDIQRGTVLLPDPDLSWCSIISSVRRLLRRST